MPTTPEAIEIFQEAGVLFAPGKAANAGGVATSALEMSQNSHAPLLDLRGGGRSKLKGIMVNIFHRRLRGRRGVRHRQGNYVVGANIAGFKKVADAMLAQGVI